MACAARGKRIVYLSEHPALALVETLANLRGDPGLFPDRFQMLKISVGDGANVVEIDAKADDASIVETRARGDAWLAGSESALLRVPSSPSPESWNYLLNPLHRESANVRIEWARSIAYDQRLVRVRGTLAA